MSERMTEWRVTYQDRITPSHIWVWHEENGDRARERYQNAVETDGNRKVTLERVTWEVFAIEYVEVNEPEDADA